SIFMDYRDFFDYMLPNKDENGNQLETYKRVAENSENLVIYGHNMHDFSMFGGLKRYINSEGYYENHAIVELNSNFLQYQYKIFGMIIVDANDETDTKFEYWNVMDFKDEKDFYNYVNEVKRRTVRLTDVDVKYGDQLLTLSTCNSTFSNGRLVVFARLLREGEDLYEGCTSVENPNVKWSNSYYTWHKVSYDPDAEFVPYG
ncbi:MAG: class B sortase, partial [Oscillospiraceae bacterium]|nr:class B sortase [Oscillospiraceae bacterium]